MVDSFNCPVGPLSLKPSSILPEKFLRKNYKVLELTHGFSNHSFRSGGVTAAENLNVPARLFKVHSSLSFFVAFECKLAPLEALRSC